MDSSRCAASKGAEAPGVPWTLGGLLRRFLADWMDELHLSRHQRHVLAQLAACGTIELGQNLYECPHCRQRHWAPRSCGDRHCPGCLAGKSFQWLEQQTKSLLPIAYYHCVFTLPSELNALIRLNPAPLYKLLFDSAAQTLLAFGQKRLGGDLGITAVLHTWGQKLDFHPHLHCIVTGGALSQDGRRWRSPKQRRYLFPVRALSVLFQGKFLDGLRQLLERGEINPGDQIPAAGRPQRLWFSQLYAKRWVVYAKRPFGGPEQVLSYLANYTHRVALSNRRLIAVDESTQTVTLSYRDYRAGGQVKRLALSVRELIRRFALHILPPRLVRIRHYGILGNNRRQRDIARARQILARRRRHPPVPPQPPVARAEPMRCPHCGRDGLRLLGFTKPDGSFQRIHAKAAPLDSS